MKNQIFRSEVFRSQLHPQIYRENHDHHQPNHPPPNSPAQSYRNIIRHGFRIAYIRPNYLFTLTDTHA
jgi:hypothetical protein